MDACGAKDLIEAATPLAMATVVPVVTWLIGRATQRPKDAAAIQTKDATIERLRAKVDMHEQRASQLPPSPVSVTNIVESAPTPDRDPPEAA